MRSIFIQKVIKIHFNNRNAIYRSMTKYKQPKVPLVSIGVPAYNNSEYIRSTIHSLAHQTYKNIEIIISDDCSTDTTFALCQKLASKEKRIRLYRQKKNLGTADNFNFVLRKATGMFFLWAAGDDIRQAHCVEKLVRILVKNPGCVLAFSAMHLFNDTDTLDVHPPFGKYSDPLQSAKIFLHHSNYAPPMLLGLYRSNVLKKVGGFHKDRRPIFQGSSEIITVYKVILQGKVGYIDETLFHKRERGFYLSKYRILQSGNIPNEFKEKVFRYFRFPIFYLFDLYYCLYYTFHSRLSGSDKFILSVYSLQLYTINLIEFITTVMRGVYSFLLGFRKRAL